MFNGKMNAIMKKIIFSLMAVSALFACQKESLIDAPQAETVTFTANFDGADTKTVLNETTRYTEWVSGDAITVHNGTKAYEFTTTDSGRSAKFSYTGNDFSGDKFFAVYPAGDHAVDMTNKTVTANIPTWQQAQIGTYDNANTKAALAVAYSENDVFAFKNATALLKFTVNTDNVTNVVFHGNYDEAITGNVKVTFGNNAITSVECLDTEFPSGENVEIKKGTWVELYAYHDDDNKYFVKGETYYIAIAPNTFTKGATVKFKIDGGSEVEVKTTSKNIEVKANTIYNLGELTYTAPEFDWGLVGKHQDWDITNPTPMEEVAENVYAVKGITLVSPGFKFAKTGLEDWETANTHFGAWKDFDGDYFDYITGMSGGWYEVYSNNLGDQSKNIGVTDWTKTYDIYLKVVEKADWGQKMAYTVVEHGTTVQY